VAGDWLLQGVVSCEESWCSGLGGEGEADLSEQVDSANWSFIVAVLLESCGVSSEVVASTIMSLGS